MDPTTRQPNARGPYRNGLQRRQQIVEAAGLVFGQYGFHGGSLRTIASRVGTTSATLVAYFRTKEGLLEAVLRHWHEGTAHDNRNYAGLDFYRSHIALMRYHLQHRGFIELFLTMSVEASDPAHPARPFILWRQGVSIERFEGELRTAVGRGEIAPMEEAEIRSEARLAIAVLDGTELQWLLDPSEDLEGLVTRYVNTSIARWTRRPLEVVAEETALWLAAHPVFGQ
jgi:AcrR family transcriptional regulator